MSKKTFYILSLTWGLPMTLIGFIVAAALRAVGIKPKKYGWCWCFEIGKYWGGVNLGIIFLSSKTASEESKNHEHGHALQNALYGFLMPFIVCIPSATRYWYRKYKSSIGKPCESKYDDAWFEGQATKWGNEFMKARAENE
jgi:hypothetical protein